VALRRNSVIAVRAVFLSTVVTWVVIQGEAGAQATQVATAASPPPALGIVYQKATWVSGLEGDRTR
jgi:hypothetical protein